MLHSLQSFLILSWLATSPGPSLSGCASTTVKSTVFSFGGLICSTGSSAAWRAGAVPRTHRSVVDDLWKFQHEKWSKVTAIDKNPPKRMYSAAATDQKNENIYIFGGWDPGRGSVGSFLNDVWKFCLANNTWEELASLPYPVSRHSACTIGEKIVIHTLKGTIIFEDDELKVQETTGDNPNDLSMCAVAENGTHLILFGGNTRNHTMSNELYLLDTKTWNWIQMKQEGDIPCKRAGCNICKSKEGFLLFGGGTTGEKGYEGGKGLIGLSDTYIVNIEENLAKWKKIDKGYMDPGPRVVPTLETVNDAIYLHGGWNPESMETYQDTWIFYEDYYDFSTAYIDQYMKYLR